MSIARFWRLHDRLSQGCARHWAPEWYVRVVSESRWKWTSDSVHRRKERKLEAVASESRRIGAAKVCADDGAKDSARITAKSTGCCSRPSADPLHRGSTALVERTVRKRRSPQTWRGKRECADRSVFLYLSPRSLFLFAAFLLFVGCQKRMVSLRRSSETKGDRREAQINRCEEAMFGGSPPVKRIFLPFFSPFSIFFFLCLRIRPVQVRFFWVVHAPPEANHVMRAFSMVKKSGRRRE